MLKGVVRGTVDATDSRIVTFTVVSVESFTYEVMVGANVQDGDHTFSGAGGDDHHNGGGWHYRHDDAAGRYDDTSGRYDDTSRHYHAGRW